jgi:pantoate--beta-alanine ligase
MLLIKKRDELRKWLDAQQKKDLKIGFAPTMGALHKGHISLIEASKKENNITVSSIFVNPTQFNNKEDLDKYPVTIEKDIDMLEEAGCDLLFLPSVKEIYPDGTQVTSHYELGDLENILEGKFRPGHFQGVCNVVDRLLEIVQPNHLYLGQKDYQQCMVIARLVSLTGKENEIKIRICPTLRENDGLAMSSRNMRLNEKEREQAITIFQSLSAIRESIQPGTLSSLKTQAVKNLERNGFKVDYVEIADALDLSPVSDWDGRQKLVALAAAYLNQVRLIDNMVIN